MNISLPLQELPAVGFLAAMDSSHRAFLASFGKFLRPKSGDILIEEGAPQPNLHVVLSGRLHVVCSAEKRPILLATLEAGDSIGEVNVFHPLSASAAVFARSECLIWQISDKELAGFCDADPLAGLDLMKGLLGLASRRLRAMNAKLSETQGIRETLHSCRMLPKSAPPVPARRVLDSKRPDPRRGGLNRVRGGRSAA